MKRRGCVNYKSKMKKRTTTAAAAIDCWILDKYDDNCTSAIRIWMYSCIPLCVWEIKCVCVCRNTHQVDASVNVCVRVCIPKGIQFIFRLILPFSGKFAVDEHSISSHFIRFASNILYSVFKFDFRLQTKKNTKKFKF